MKLFLFGGAEIALGQVQPLKDLIKQTIIDLHPPSVLLVPFARLNPDEEEWKEGWFTELLSNTGIEILDARIDSDIDKATDSVIFINGGHQRRELAKAINNNQKLLNIVLHAEYIVAESAGSMVMGEYLRADRAGNEIVKGVGILKNTIIEPHYTERNYQQLLLNDMQKSGMKYGVGIDCVTALVVDPNEFPDKWDKIGIGNVDLKIAKGLDKVYI